MYYTVKHLKQQSIASEYIKQTKASIKMNKFLLCGQAASICTGSQCNFPLLKC